MFETGNVVLHPTEEYVKLMMYALNDLTVQKNAHIM